MNKTAMVELLNQKCEMSKSKASQVVDVLFEGIQDTLIQGDNVRLPGIGTLEVRQRKSRYGRNPSTGEEIFIPAKRTVGLKVSSTIKEKINH